MYLNIAIKSFEFLEIDAPAAVGVEDVCGMSEVVSRADIVTYSSTRTKISKCFALIGSCTHHFDGVFSRFHPRILCKQSLQIICM